MSEPLAALVSLKVDGARRSVISRSTVMILALVLIGTELGRAVPGELASFCGLAGLAGFVAYIGLEIADRRRKRKWVESLKVAAERRLSDEVESIGVDQFTLRQFGRMLWRATYGQNRPA
jgi:hypothetical protein